MFGISQFSFFLDDLSNGKSGVSSLTPSVHEVQYVIKAIVVSFPISSDEVWFEVYFVIY